jgi:hypothetical protein
LCWEYQEAHFQMGAQSLAQNWVQKTRTSAVIRTRGRTGPSSKLGAKNAHFRRDPDPRSAAGIPEYSGNITEKSRRKYFLRSLPSYMLASMAQ